jgi:Ca2+-binding EF-hand superfamily protein
MGKALGIIAFSAILGISAAAAMAAVGDRDVKPGAKVPRERGAGLGLKRFDADNDLTVTVDEFLKRRTEAFTKRDKNGDGSLDGDELGQAPLGQRERRQEQRLQRAMKRLDDDGDGKLTRAEFERDPAVAGGRDARAEAGGRDARAEAGGRDERAVAAGRDERTPRPASRRTVERQKLLFAFYDRNADGVLEQAEYEAGRAEEIEFNRRRTMHALDRNADGKVTLEEYTADARFRFLRLDLDRDGRITAADLPPVERQRWSQR